MKLAVSIHRTGVNESNGDRDEDIAIGTGGVAVRTRINTDLDVADASQLDFFYWLLTPEMFATIAGQTNRYARVKFAAIPSLPCRKSTISHAAPTKGLRVSFSQNQNDILHK